LVDDVVVDQRRHVDEFHRTCRVHERIGLQRVAWRRTEHEQRPKPLAAGGEGLGSGLRQQRRVTRHDLGKARLADRQMPSEGTDVPLGDT
jgi:hypothetical protein